MSECPIHFNLSGQCIYLGVSPFDQASKRANHARAFASKGCESLVLICEISTGSCVTCSLGVAGGGCADIVLQACNAGSISSAPSLKPSHFLRVVMGVSLLGSSVCDHGICFLFCSCLRLF
ncbi:hypothetical protein [Comamonas sp. lk]|uniref:hypothetical protein n=1 Tax=Comamonas sp. lk TaxID=2201272 RepID=UPI0013CEB1EE|nr:hypothetical protein [Comamonas sp. lk]